MVYNQEKRGRITEILDPAVRAEKILDSGDMAPFFPSNLLRTLCQKCTKNPLSCTLVLSYDHIQEQENGPS